MDSAVKMTNIHVWLDPGEFTLNTGSMHCEYEQNLVQILVEFRLNPACTPG